MADCVILLDQRIAEQISTRRWLLLSNVACNGERTRTLQVLKSRGMPHSNQVREFVFPDRGVGVRSLAKMIAASRGTAPKREAPATPRSR